MGKVLVSAFPSKNDIGLDAKLMEFYVEHETKPYVQLGVLEDGTNIWVISSVDIPKSYEYLGDWLMKEPSAKLVIDDALGDVDIGCTILLWD